MPERGLPRPNQYAIIDLRIQIGGASQMAFEPFLVPFEI